MILVSTLQLLDILLKMEAKRIVIAALLQQSNIAKLLSTSHMMMHRVAWCFAEEEIFKNCNTKANFEL